MDEGIRSRIIENVKNVVKMKVLVYTLLVATVSVVIFFAISRTEAGTLTSNLMIALLFAFISIGLIAVLYIYFSTVREQTRVFNEAIYMTLGKVVSKNDNNNITVKVPGDKAVYKIKCEAEFYAKAVPDMRVLVVSASKKNANQMFGLEPSTYDKDGLL